MAHGVCLNETCEKDKWWLTKHPNDYANGVKCPTCGTSRTDIEWGSPQEGGSEPQQEAQQPQEPRREPQQQGREVERAPARRQPQGRSPAPTTVEGGQQGQAADLVAAADADVAPQQRIDAAERAGTWAGRAAGSLIEYVAAKRSKQSQNAEGARIQRVENKPACTTDGCNHVFAEIKDHEDEVQCPECGAVYNVKIE